MAFIPDIPRDILYHISTYVGAHSTSDLLSFMLTSRHVYGALGSHSDPHPFARIFLRKFPLSQARRDSDSLDDRRLADELIRRCCVLQRVRRRDLRWDGLAGDLYTALWICMERNEEELLEAGFADYLEDVFITHFSAAPIEDKGKGKINELESAMCGGFILWLCVLCWSRGEFVIQTSSSLFLPCLGWVGFRYRDVRSWMRKDKNRLLIITFFFLY